MFTGPHLVNDGLVLCLDAANPLSYPGSGTTWNDLSGNGNNGTLVNGPTFDSGNGGSIVFDGGNDYVNTTLSNTSFTSLNCSLEIFFNTGVIQNNKFTTLAGQRSSSDSRTLLGLWIEARNSWPGNYSSNYGILGITFGTIVHADLAIKSTPGLIIDNTWYHVVLVSSNVDTKMYINGNLVSTLVSSGTLDTSVAGTFGVGCYGISSDTLQYPSNLSNQKIPINRVYNKALTTPEILQNYNATKTRFGL
jgi:hypothetical protein